VLFRYESSFRSKVGPPSINTQPMILLLSSWVGILLHSLVVFNVDVATASRDEISFNFGWRHRTGLTQWADPDSLPPEGTDPGFHPREASSSYNDDDWQPVQLPHDALIATRPSQKACPDGCSGHSYIPRHLLWYRKEFYIPSSWKESLIWLEFDGSFRNTTVWINGEWQMNHAAGYLPFSIQLDSIATFGQDNPNTIAVFVDPDNGDQGGRSHGSGWWYEGGGLYRNARLIRTDPVHFSSNGLFVHSQVDFDDKHEASAVLSIEASIQNDGDGHEKICMELDVVNPDRTLLLSMTSEPTVIEKGQIVSVSATSSVMSPELWTTLEPTLYKIKASLKACSSGEELDMVETHHGFRSLRFDANHGFFLNEERYKIRGFCDHDSFGILGMAVPDRVNLFRVRSTVLFHGNSTLSQFAKNMSIKQAQASRSIGGNGRRASHNPPDPRLLDIYDQLGVVVIDENRLFANNSKYVGDMAGLVLRDRNHPSVILWSFCNENGCEGDHETGGPAFQNITETYDGTRPTLANMFSFNDLLSNTVDVQGFSHRPRKQLDDCHKAMPDKPILMSECCSCNTMRGEDVGCETTKDNPHSNCDQIAFNARCLDNYVNASDGVDYAAGTMVWTLFDYYGEPPSAGLTVSSTYGQFDLVGFPKAAAFWFRTQWLLGVSDQRPDIPFKTLDSVEVQIVESWESPDSWNETRGNSTRTIHAYSNAQFIELLVNGKSQGSLPVSPMVDGGGSYAEWEKVPWEAGKLVAVARSSDGTKRAQTERSTSGRPTTLELSLDCPSKATGTGEAVLLDGQDVALVRASILDASGSVVHMATNNVSFSILSGPGTILGTGNGDPKSYEPNNASWHSTYHGLVRVVVRVTSIEALSPAEQALMEAVDGPADMHTFLRNDDQDIVIEATTPGLPPVQLTIPTSTDTSSASVLAIAAFTAGKPVDFFGSGKKSGDAGVDVSVY
jgi:hypothetical protein